ncbi:RecE family exodeoxyribonuclease [Citrobacter amalonaticus]|uniref:RecE family exodeoxyribonuclease n=1 Tax=Citrobacter amalonaticus TaxID=35703 RepID=UPI00309064B1|nr:RecE family exodeoxyribonuclease [Citrobacter amalonaticus]
MSGTNPVFLVRKAKKSSGQKDAVLWCSDDFESANATLDYLLIKSGAKLKDYFKAVATNFPVVNELPPEGELSLTFCDFYQLGSDNMTWAQITGVTLPSSEAVAAARQRIVDGVDTETGEVLEDHTETFGNENNDVKPGDLPAYAYNVNGELMEEVEKEMNQPVARMSERHRILSQFILDDAFSHHVTPVQLAEVSRLELDMSNSYIQDMLLACHNVPAIQKLDTPNLWKFTDAFKRIFPQDKRHTLHLMMNFAQAFVDTEYIDRGLLVKEWVKGNRVSEINRTPSGANAGGGNKTDRLTPLTKTGLEYEIALGLIARNKEFDIYSPSFEIDVEANAIMNLSRSGEDNVLDEFIATCKLFEEMPGGMDYSRACNVATVKTTPEELFKSPFRHREYLNRVMTETDHAHPDEMIVDIACGRSSMPMPQKVTAEEVNKILAASRGDYVEGISDPNDPKWVKTESSQQTTQPEKVTDGVFDAAALIKNSSTYGTKKDPETTSNVQVQKTDGDEKQAGDALYAGESNLGNGEEADAGEQAILNQSQAETHQNADSVNHSEPEAQQNAPETQLDEPAQEWPSYFEPGRYEGVPNDVYHAANGISSTMVKDARVSLMYFHSRHIDKTISRESTEALSFGSLVHTLVLEPEKFDDEFAIFPGIPAGAFTNTDTLKAFIREYNADKPKAEQLKLTGKKEELQESIRAVNPDAIFADEYEQQWRESMTGKTILTSEQLTLAKNIQQAIFNNRDASDLLNNPGRQSEVSYFGIDEETGLNIRVRPDIELRTANENTCADLKTISIGNVRQDRIKERLHREIIDRDYHLSAAMYCDVAGLDSFSWIFVNKEPGYHWVAVVEASELLLELGRKEYRRVLRQIYDAMENDIWPAPITETYTDELNDYDKRRLEALEAE